jgi:hypothetical protein
MLEEHPHGNDRGYGRRRIAHPPDTARVCAFEIYDPAGQPLAGCLGDSTDRLRDPAVACPRPLAAAIVRTQ